MKCNQMVYTAIAILTIYGVAWAEGNSATNTLVTNYDTKLQVTDSVKNIPVPTAIYDAGVVVYSKAFAERFGYPVEYVADLDTGMHALEFRIKSDGGFVRCYLNTLLDNSLGLDFPDHDYKNRFERNGEMMRFPAQVEGYLESEEDKSFRINTRQAKWHYYSRNTRLASYDYEPKKKGTWASSYTFESYSNRYFKGMDYVSLFITCGQSVYQEMQRDKASLWFKKTGGDDYSLTVGTKPEQFMKFRIPPSFAKRAAELMRPVAESNYNFFKAIKAQREQNGREHE